LAAEAFTIYPLSPPAFLKRIRAIVDDPRASQNDFFVAGAILLNAAIAAEGVLPLCQDTGSPRSSGIKATAS
jgi:fumarate hydratase class I